MRRPAIGRFHATWRREFAIRAAGFPQPPAVTEPSQNAGVVSDGVKDRSGGRDRSV